MEKIERYHSLDALRSTMLLLGLVLHASQAYLLSAYRDNIWYFYDASSSFLMAPICGAIHVYRMPVFFLLAGFFTAMLVVKRGVRGLLKNRANRVALPLAVALVTIVPLILVATEFAWSRVGGVPGFQIQTGFKGMLSNNLYHLWFLWHLIIFYLATAIVVFVSHVLRRQSKSVGSCLDKIESGIDRLNRSRWNAVVFVLPAIVFLSQMKGHPGSLEFAFRWIPPWYVLGIYGLCFWFGWRLFNNRDRLKHLASHANLRMLVGVAAVGVYLLGLKWYLEHGKPAAMIWPLCVLAAIAIWTMVEGWLAFFQRYFSHSSNLSRYISDSSYWVYLIHVPVLLVWQGLLAEVKVSAEGKFLMVLLLTTAVCFLSYHTMVRATWVGQLLNGRRYPVWSGKTVGQEVEVEVGSLEC